MSTISIDDCTLARTDEGLVLNLPRVIDLNGASPVRNDGEHGDSHIHYPNQYGDLQIACDYVARFLPSEDVLKKLPRGFTGDFRSLYPWGISFQGSRFLYNSRRMLKEHFPEGMENPKEVAMNIPYLRAHIEGFLAWVNEFGRQHGEEFLYDYIERYKAKGWPLVFLRDIA